jgi:hypothetical protein
VLAVTLLVRHEVKAGKQVVSWALVSFCSAAGAQAALDGTADLSAQHTGMVTKKVDEMQATQSTGAMGEVMRKHVTARAAAVRESRSFVGIAVACASPLCEVLCKAVAEVDVAEWHWAAQVLAALHGVDPARAGGECTKPDQCTLWNAYMAPDSALGVGE